MKLIRHVTNMLLAAFVCGTLGLVEFVGIPTQEVPTVGPHQEFGSKAPEETPSGRCD